MRYYIDCNSKYGRITKRHPLLAYEPDELLREMARCNIHAAVTENQVSTHYAYRPGNRDLIAQCKENSRLLPLALCPPTYKWEQREGVDYLPYLCDQVSGIVLRPRTCAFSLDPRIMEDFAGILVEKKRPLVIPTAELESFIHLANLLEAFPELPVVMTSLSWGYNRMLFPLLERHANLHFDMSDDHLNDLLPFTKRHFGLDRLLFGSGYPGRGMGTLKALIEYADVSEDDKNLVAHGNACRLFGLDATALAPYEGSQLDPIAEAMDNGRPLREWFIFDSHGHIADEDDDCISQLVMPNAERDSIAKKLERLGVDKVILSSWEGIKTGGARANETVYKAMTAYPGMMYGYATANPNYDGDIDNALANHEERGFIGIKPYAILHGKLTDPGYQPWFAYGNQRKMFVLVHSGSQDVVDQVAALAPKYPDLYFLMAHSGADMATAESNVALAKQNDNVFLEITYTASTRGSIEYMVREVGSPRVLFGTDLPMRDPAPQLAWVAYAEISMEDKVNILGENMHRIVERVLPPNGRPPSDS